MLQHVTEQTTRVCSSQKRNQECATKIFAFHSFYTFFQLMNEFAYLILSRKYEISRAHSFSFLAERVGWKWLSLKLLMRFLSAGKSSTCITRREHSSSVRWWKNIQFTGVPFTPLTAATGVRTRKKWREPDVTQRRGTYGNFIQWAAFSSEKKWPPKLQGAGTRRFHETVHKERARLERILFKRIAINQLPMSL